MEALEVLGACLLIMAARIGDVSLGTLRTVVMVQGRRGLAFVLAIAEILIWVFVVSAVITQIRDTPIYGVAYALGFALGTWIGMLWESRLALGRQAVRIITRLGPDMASVLRERGLVVTQFDGHGRDGPVQQLFLELPRRLARGVIAQARAVDPGCYVWIDDVRFASTGAPTKRADR